MKKINIDRFRVLKVNFLLLTFLTDINPNTSHSNMKSHLIFQILVRGSREHLHKNLLQKKRCYCCGLPFIFLNQCPKFKSLCTKAGVHKRNNQFSNSTFFPTHGMSAHHVSLNSLPQRVSCMQVCSASTQ